MQAKMILIFPTKTSWCFPATPVFFLGATSKHSKMNETHVPINPNPTLTLLNPPITKPRLAPAGFGQQRPSRLSSLQAGLFWHNLDGSTSDYPLQVPPVRWCNGIIPCLSSPPSLPQKKTTNWVPCTVLCQNSVENFPNRTSIRVENVQKNCMDSCQFESLHFTGFADLLQVWSVKLPNLGAQLVGVEIRFAT